MENTPCTQDGTDALVASLAERQHGVFHTRQALALGMTPRMIHWRAKKERIVRLHRGVYRVAGAAPSWRQQVMAACLALGPGTVASHRSAGALWSLDGMEERLVEVTVTGRAERLHGVTVHRTRFLPASGVSTRDRIPVTKAHRTVVDLASVLDEFRLEQALDSAATATTPDARRGHTTRPATTAPLPYGWLVFTFTAADLRDPARAAVNALSRAYGIRVRGSGRRRRPSPETSPRS